MVHRAKPGGGLRGRTPRALVAGGTTLVLTVGLVGLSALPASAEPGVAPDAFSHTEAGTFSGVVPDGVCAVEVIVRGGAGGSSINTANTNGAGAEITATYPVVAGQEFEGLVGAGGGEGLNAQGTWGVGGYPGGGNAGVVTAPLGNNWHHGAGGGGYSTLSIAGSELVVAGGGGGSGGGHSTTRGFGGDAGLPTAAGVAAGSDGTQGIDDAGSGSVSMSPGLGGQSGDAGAGGTHPDVSARDGFAGGMIPAVGGLPGFAEAWAVSTLPVGVDLIRQGGFGGVDAGPDSGAGGGGGYTGGGGGASTNGQGAGAPTSTGVGAAGGGGGASYVAAGAAGGLGEATAISSTTGPKLAGTGTGADGLVSLNWIACEVFPPATDPGATSGPQGQPQTWTPSPEAGSFPIDGGSLTLIDPDTNEPVSEVVVDGVGTYSLEAGSIRFVPEPSFTGTAQPLTYRVSDTEGNPATNTYTPTVVGVTPIANPDVSENVVNVSQSVYPLDNDAPGSAEAPLVPTTLTLLDAEGNAAESVTVPEGVYTVGGTASEPRIVFTPNADYFGAVTPVDYRVSDTNGTPAQSTYTPNVTAAPPVTDNGETTGPQGVPQNWTPSPTAGSFPVEPGTVTLLDAEGNPVESITVPGEGVYTVEDGELVFTPEPQFVGQATTVDYRVSDRAGQHARGTYTPSVTPVAPTADDDSSTGWWNTPQSVDPLANDAPGDPGVPLVPGSLTLLDAEGNEVETVTVLEGVYTIDWTEPAQPRIVFTPNRGFTGTPTPVDYRIEDANGTPAEATYQPEVRGPEDSQDLVKTQQCGTTVTFDTTAEVGTLDPTSVVLIDADRRPVHELRVDGEGTWQVDSQTGKVTFTPDGCRAADPTPVKWEGRLLDGTPIEGTLTVHYTKAPAASGMAETGGELSALPAWLGLLLLLGGFGAVLMARRRRA